MIFEEDDYLAHYGILRKSGRYPWGSGGTQAQRNRTFLDSVQELKDKGLSEVEVAKGLGITTSELRAAKSIAKNAEKQAQISRAEKLRDHGHSPTAIGQKMGLNESSVRSLLAPGQKEKSQILDATAHMLKDHLARKGLLDVGAGVEHHLGISRTKLDNALALLREEGYEIHNVQIDQLGTNKKTLIKVLAPAGTTYKDIVTDKSKIGYIRSYTEDGGRSWTGIKPPLAVHPDRVAVKYKEEGGDKADGVIYVRPGVKDLSMGGANYAQVRISVGGTHYLKGMAVHKDDLPPGVDLMFNTNKSNTGDKLDAMKKLKDDPENPFGAIVRQLTDHKDKVTSALNIVNEEGNWDDWSRNLSSQLLSKQSPSLAKSQLDLTFENKRRELDDILKLTNPAVRQKLLEDFADGADSSSIHMKAAGLPRQATQVILPVTSIKPHEIYAPNFKDGENVVLVRYPHGGIFEIPQLTVNNKNPEARKMLGNAKDAVGIHHEVAAKLSGADFDGDTVLVIPNPKGQIKTAPSLAGLKGFDPQSAYPGYPGMPKVTARTKGIQMGLVSNLITDMTIQGASHDELARAVRHSMVVIDAEKHNLNHKQSAIDNGIPQLMTKYQKRSQGGASTLISKKKGTVNVPERKLRPASQGGPIDKATGKKVYVETGASYVDKTTGKTVIKTTKVNKVEATNDAHTLSSGTTMEKIYADHSNKLKDLANEARKHLVNTKSIPYSPSAKTAYQKEVDRLNAALKAAQYNAPLERHAQVLANAQVSLKRQANPDMDAAELKKIKSLALIEARNRTGAKKDRIVISEAEWAAIQAGAITHDKLSKILLNADMDRVRQLSTPKQKVLMTSTKVNRARAMLSSGYTQAQVADALGVSLTTLKTALQ